MLVWLIVATSGCSSSAHEARSDVIIQWNQQVISVGGPQIQRTLAMVHVAMFDAINAIEHRYVPYLTLPAPPSGTDTQAAAAAAAYGVLVRLMPDERSTLTSALQRSLADLPDGSRRQQGVAYGDVVAKAIYDARLDDNILSRDTSIALGAAPGDYQLTDPESELMNVTAQTWKPFALRSASQFRSDPPPALNSADYARDFAEVKRLGGLTSVRTHEQEEVARWYVEPGVTQLNRIARTEASADGRSVLEHAWLFALLDVSIADAITGAFDAKYAHRFWRPITAIRRAGTDANPKTEQDLTWSPFLPTPPHPEYPSVHAAVHAAGARVLTTYFGRFHPFRATSSSVPGAVRAYKDFDAFAAEGRMARILGGMHFRTSVEQGAVLGTRVADWVLEHCLVPISRS